MADYGQRAAHVAWARGFAEALQQAKLARLQQLKKMYDPANVFRLNQNIPPAP